MTSSLIFLRDFLLAVYVTSHASCMVYLYYRNTRYYGVGVELHFGMSRYRLFPIVPGIITAAHRRTPSLRRENSPRGVCRHQRNTRHGTPTPPYLLLHAHSHLSRRLEVLFQALHPRGSVSCHGFEAGSLQLAKIQITAVQQAAWNRRCCELREPEQEATGCGTAKKAGGMRREGSARCEVQRRRR